MRVHGTSRLYEFSAEHPSARVWVAAWLAECGGASWAKPADIQKRFPTASFLANKLVVFNVNDGGFNLATYVDYNYGVVLVKWVGTRAEYISINWDKVIDGTRSS